MTETILVEAVTRRSAVQKMTVALDAWQGLWGALGWGSKHAQGNRGSGRARKLSRALNHRWSIDPATLSCPVWIHQCARRNDFSQRSLVMSRALILIAAPSLVVISLALSADAQQLPDVTPGMVEMTEPPTPAPAGFNNRTNGFAEQAQFDRDREAFEEIEKAGDGLGPVYNSTSCVSCHQNPVTGSSSQTAELRAGHNVPDDTDPNRRKVKFVEPAGGSVIRQRATEPKYQERVDPKDDIRTFRMSNTILGDGYI